MTARQKNDPEEPQKDRCGYLYMKQYNTYKQGGFSEKQVTVTWNGTNISQVFMLHRAVQR